MPSPHSYVKTTDLSGLLADGELIRPPRYKKVCCKAGFSISAARPR